MQCKMFEDNQEKIEYDMVNISRTYKHFEKSKVK
jgi:hypothetical protein